MKPYALVLLLAVSVRGAGAGPMEAVYGRLPLAFEAASAPDAAFVARTAGGVIVLEPTAAIRFPPRPGEGTAEIRMHLRGSNPRPRVEPEARLEGSAHHLIGDPTGWVRDVATFSRVVYRQVYAGVDLVYFGNGRRLEYDFLVAPGASYTGIRVAFSGIDRMEIDGRGDLVLAAGARRLRHHRPRVYQTAGGKRRELRAAYIRRGRHAVGFEVEAHNPALPLVIDPVLTYSSYLAGSGDDRAYGVAVDDMGCAYIVGETWSANFPRTAGSHSGPRGSREIFITKLNPAGTVSLYSTYLGGGGADSGRAIAVDGSGNVYITGTTSSPDFPITPGSMQTSRRVPEAAFVAKLNAAGTALLYSTFIGGGGAQYAAGIAVNAAGEAAIAGYTSSVDFPVTPDAVQRSFGGGYFDAFVAKLNAHGSALVYGSYLGGSGNDTGAGIAVDAEGNTYVTGQTDSQNFPVRNAFRSAVQGMDAFVAKLNGFGELVYSTYLGGHSADLGAAIAADSAGAAYVVGATISSDFPVTVGAFQGANRGSYDAFVAKLHPSGSGLAWSTYLGGSGSDEPRAIAVSGGGMAAVVGWASSSDFPVQSDSSPRGGGDAFVAAFNAGSGALAYSGYLGGSGADVAQGVAYNSWGSAYVAGFTFSSDFPVTAGAYQTDTAGSIDAFAAKIGFGAPPEAVSVTPASGSGASATFTFVFSDPDGDANLYSAAIIINSVLNGKQACYLTYDPADSSVSLAGDDGTVATRIPLGSVATAQNSQCSVQGAGSSASLSGTSVTLRLALAFRPSFAGNKNIYMFAQDFTGLNSGMQIRGNWTVDPGSPEACAYALETTSKVFPSQGGLASVSVTAPSGCGWSVSHSTSWITFTAGSFGSGSGAVQYAVAGNAGAAARTAAITIAGRVFWISQHGLNQSVVLNSNFFVRQLCLDLLGREIDSAGLIYWNGELEGGRITRAGLAYAYFISEEFRGGGLFVISAYAAILGRDPDFDGWLYHLDTLRGGVPKQKLIDGFVQSAEFKQAYGTLDNSGFVRRVYLNVLGREPDAGGLSYWTGVLNGGTSRAGMMYQFVTSGEFQARIQSRAMAMLLYMGFLRRSPEPAGAAYWASILNAGAVPTGVLNIFITSPEYLARF